MHNIMPVNVADQLDFAGSDHTARLSLAALCKNVSNVSPCRIMKDFRA